MNIKPFERLREHLLTNGVPCEVAKRAEAENHFFTPEMIEKAVKAIACDLLTANIPNGKPVYKSCAVIMAGNIPLVGFADMMCCVALGLKTYIKPSSKDRVLMEWIVGLLRGFGADTIFYWNESIEVECVIATGSNNANRYFESRFGGLPSVKRGSRSSVAVIDGTESQEEIEALWHDLFDYYGLGCRSVSHLFIPKGFDPTPIFEILSTKPLQNSHYLNAYHQRKVVKIMCGEPFFDGGFFVASKGSTLTPSLGEITYSYFDTTILDENHDKLQCVVGHGFIAFGESQHPALTDWADGVNLFKFLIQ